MESRSHTQQFRWDPKNEAERGGIAPSVHAYNAAKTRSKKKEALFREPLQLRGTVLSGAQHRDTQVSPALLHGEQR